MLDFVDFMLDSEHTSAVLSIAERFSSAAKLKTVTEKTAELDKPIVTMKVGRSVEGSRAAASHTGAVSGADAVCDAILRQNGIIRVNGTSDLVQYAKLLRRRNRPLRHYYHGLRYDALAAATRIIAVLEDLALKHSPG